MTIAKTQNGQRVSMPTVYDFHANPYMKNNESFIDNMGLDERFGLYLVLSNTIFYPHGGGQKGDRGEIVIDPDVAETSGIPNVLEVKDTRKNNDLVLHILGNVSAIDEDVAQEFLLGNEASVSIDWDFRFRQMRLHSIAHLLHFFVEKFAGKELPYPSTSDLQDGFGINRYDLPNIVANESAEAIYQDFQAFSQQEIEIETYPDETEVGFRYWQCADYVVPCGGTHLSNTSEIGSFELDIKTKKGKTTMKFTLS